MPLESSKQNEYYTLIIKYLDNDLMSDEERRILKEWILKSKENENVFKNFALTWEASNILLQDKSCAKTKFDELIKKQKQNRTRKLISWTTSSVAAVALFIITLQLFTPIHLLGDKELTFSSDETKKEVILPDGSHVWLNAHSSISYPKSFEKSRNVKLTGEALFDVVNLGGENFTVETSKIKIEVIGTTFLINDRIDTDVAQTVLESGAVSVMVNNTGNTLNLNPDELFVYNSIDGTSSVETVNVSSYTGWIEDELTFTNILMNELIIQLEKRYNVDIVCNNQRILEIPVSLTVNEEPIDEILFLLSQIVPFNWYVNSENAIILN